MQDKVWVKKLHTKKLAINKGFTIFVQYLWYLVKIVTSWVNHFDKVSWSLEKNCGIFTNSQFFNVCNFFNQTLCCTRWGRSLHYSSFKGPVNGKVESRGLLIYIKRYFKFHVCLSIRNSVSDSFCLSKKLFCC